MKRFSEQLKKKADSVRLSALERRDLRERLQAYMEYHPLPAEMQKKQPVSGSKLSRVSTIRVDMFQVSKFLGSFAAIILVAVPLMAEKSVPGDILYPVKVQFNEEVRSSLSLSPYAKVEWETKRLERRIAEARLLASEGKLTPEVEAEVALAVKEHSSAAQQEIAVLRQSDNDEATIAEIAFASALDVQSEVLESDIKKSTVVSLTATSEGSGNSILAIAGAVDEARKTTSSQSGDGVSYEKLMARLEDETTRAYEYFNTIESVASADEKADIERRLQDIERKVKESGKLSRENGEATALLVTALADTRKLISFMTNIDVRENVSVEDLVPVTLTEEERVALVNEQLQETTRLKSLVTDVLPELRVDVAEKTIAGLIELDAAVNVASTSLESEDVETAETASANALKLARALTTLTKTEIYDDNGNLVESEPSNSTSTPPTAGTTTPVISSTTDDNGL